VTVLDASALLAYVLGEPGSEAVEEAIAESGAIGAVNLAEVLAKLADGGAEPGEAMDRLGVLPIEIVPFDEAAAVETARLRPATSSAGLSLGDRACLAVARLLDRPVLTADAAWAGLVPDVDVRVIR
jgi:PIN domain nuclease of toxin-antitoxin system